MVSSMVEHCTVNAKVIGSSPILSAILVIMEILTLIIKQNFFDEIISGKKIKEFREIRPNTQKKYCDLDEDGYCKEKDGILQPRKYDAIRFYAGYNRNRNTALVEINKTDIELLVDESNNFIEYEHDGEKYLAAQVVYSLGKILSV
jgi:hypothetical protein